MLFYPRALLSSRFANSWNSYTPRPTFIVYKSYESSIIAIQSNLYTNVFQSIIHRDNIFASLLFYKVLCWNAVLSRGREGAEGRRLRLCRNQSINQSINHRDNVSASLLFYKALCWNAVLSRGREGAEGRRLWSCRSQSIKQSINHSDIVHGLTFLQRALLKCGPKSR